MTSTVIVVFRFGLSMNFEYYETLNYYTNFESLFSYLKAVSRLHANMYTIVLFSLECFVSIANSKFPIEIKLFLLYTVVTH